MHLFSVAMVPMCFPVIEKSWMRLLKRSVTYTCLWSVCQGGDCHRRLHNQFHRSRLQARQRRASKLTRRPYTAGEATCAVFTPCGHRVQPQTTVTDGPKAVCDPKHRRARQGARCQDPSLKKRPQPHLDTAREAELPHLIAVGTERELELDGRCLVRSAQGPRILSVVRQVRQVLLQRLGAVAACKHSQREGRTGREQRRCDRSRLCAHAWKRGEAEESARGAKKASARAPVVVGEMSSCRHDLLVVDHLEIRLVAAVAVVLVLEFLPDARPHAMP